MKELKNTEHTKLLYEKTFVAERHAFVLLENFLTAIAQELHCTPKVLKQLLVVTDEIFTNIVVHGYVKKRKEVNNYITVHIFFDTNRNILTLQFIDTGIMYNPLETKEPDIQTSLENRAIGGLGIFLVKKLMDNIDYIHKNGKNILTLQKKL